MNGVTMQQWLEKIAYHVLDESLSRLEEIKNIVELENKVFARKSCYNQQYIGINERVKLND